AQPRSPSPAPVAGSSGAVVSGSGGGGVASASGGGVAFASGGGGGAQSLVNSIAPPSTSVRIWSGIWAHPPAGSSRQAMQARSRMVVLLVVRVKGAQAPG